MKTISVKEAQNSFESFLDSVQSEPVVVTRRNRPVGVMVSMNNFPDMLELANSMNEYIANGVNAGLADAEAGRVRRLNDSYISDLKQRLRQRIEANQEAWKATA